MATSKKTGNKTKKVAIISGGLGSIGFGIFERLAQEGFLVTSLSRSLPEAKAEIYKNQGHLFLRCDLADNEQTIAAVDTVSKRYGRLDACVHCAVSPILRKKFLETDLEEFRGQFEVGLFGGFVLLREAAKIMKTQNSGRLIAITSASIEPNVPAGHMPAYISAKYALRGLLREAAKELSPYNITVNAVAPGFVDTMLNRDIPPRMMEFLKEKNPFKRIVSPKDIAEVVAFLCSKSGDALTGLHLPVTFGESITL